MWPIVPHKLPGGEGELKMSPSKGLWPTLSAGPSPSLEEDTDLQSFSESLGASCVSEFRI